MTQKAKRVMILREIPLNDNWQCAYSQAGPDPEALVSSRRVQALSGWSRDQQRAREQAAWLSREFVLQPMAQCVRYWLVIESAPPGAQIYMNETLLAEYTIGDEGAPFALDVTNHVWLEVNTIAFRVPADGRFAGVCLQAVPCE